MNPAPSTPGSGAAEALPIEERYRRALLWIQHAAGLHYFGGAFEPEHMRDLANIAADALDLRWDADGSRRRKDLPDYEAAMSEAKVRAREMAAAMGFDLVTGEELDEP